MDKKLLLEYAQSLGIPIDKSNTFTENVWEFLQTAFTMNHINSKNPLNVAKGIVNLCDNLLLKGDLLNKDTSVINEDKLNVFNKINILINLAFDLPNIKIDLSPQWSYGTIEVSVVDYIHLSEAKKTFFAEAVKCSDEMIIETDHEEKYKLMFYVNNIRENN